MEKQLPKSVVIPLGVCFVVAGAALIFWGIPMAIGKGSISFPTKG
jgi:hypothetical protein